MDVLDLFSGIGGFSLGLEAAGMKTVAFCENDPYCRKVLEKRWPDVPIYNDIRDINEPIKADVICGGFPCQPFSVAGNRKGSEDDRHLWPEMLRVIAQSRPTWVIGENVNGLIGLGLDGVLADLEAEGYTGRAFVIPACAVNAPHRRERVWIIANTDSPKVWNESRRGNGENREDPTESGDYGEEGIMAYAKRPGLEGYPGYGKGSHEPGRKCATEVRSISTSSVRRPLADPDNQRELQQSGSLKEIWGWVGHEGWWDSEPDVGRVADGVPARMDRLKCLGNAVVPQVVKQIGKAVMYARTD